MVQQKTIDRKSLNTFLCSLISVNDNEVNLFTHKGNAYIYDFLTMFKNITLTLSTVESAKPVWVSTCIIDNISYSHSSSFPMYAIANCVLDLYKDVRNIEEFYLPEHSEVKLSESELKKMDSKMKRILQNAVMIKDSGVVLKSTHRHDFVDGKTKSGDYVFVDGGNEYLRSSLNNPDEVQKLHLYVGSPFEEIVEKLAWGTRGIDGKEQLKYKRLIDCDTDHLKNIKFYLDSLNVDGSKNDDIYLKVVNHILDTRK